MAIYRTGGKFDFRLSLSLLGPPRSEQRQVIKPMREAVGSNPGRTNTQGR